MAVKVDLDLGIHEGWPVRLRGRLPPSALPGKLKGEGMRLLSGRGRLAVFAAVAAGFAAGGIAYASVPDSGTGLIHGCYSQNGALATNGTQLNIIDKASASCNKNQQEITWNQTGPQGVKGDKGDPGTFSGSFASPNGQYSMSVTDNGITLAGPTSSILIGSGGLSMAAGGSHVSIDNAGAVDVKGSSVTVKGNTDVTVEGSTEVHIRGGVVTHVDGGIVELNGCNRHVSGTNDQTVSTYDGGSAVLGFILTGSPSVCAG